MLHTARKSNPQLHYYFQQLVCFYSECHNVAPEIIDKRNTNSSWSDWGFVQHIFSIESKSYWIVTLAHARTHTHSSGKVYTKNQIFLWIPKLLVFSWKEKCVGEVRCYFENAIAQHGIII